jgi:hypothetical protein
MRSRGYKLDPSAIKDAVNPHDFYLCELNLCRFGYRSGEWATSGICPFHTDTKEGSFKVNITTGAFRCWSCGAAGGDIIAFIQQRDHLGFTETLRKLCNDWGISC